MMKELQLMRAEDNNSPQSIISALFYVVKELRFIYKQLFREKKWQMNLKDILYI